MALWAMGDFHLAFSVDKPMEVLIRYGRIMKRRSRSMSQNV